MIINAYAKINLTLDVTGIRPNGYHDLYTVFQPISLHDTLTIEKTSGDGVDFTCTDQALMRRNNLVIRAARAMQARFHEVKGLSIHLDKHIPSCAGLGGGSADAAAVIRGVDELFGLHLTSSEMISIGAALGADVPAQILLRAALGEGIGDILTPVGSSFVYPVVIYQPDIICPTDDMYRRLDEAIGDPQGLNPESLHASRLVMEGLREQSMEKLIAGSHNIFEKAIPDAGRLEREKALLRACGFSSAVMSGSGSSIFCLAENPEDFERAAKRLCGYTPEGSRVFRCFAFDLAGTGPDFPVEELFREEAEHV